MSIPSEYPTPWRTEEETGGQCVIDANGRWVFGLQYDETDRDEAEVIVLVAWIVRCVNVAEPPK